MGHSNIGLTMDVYGKITGRMALSPEQEARLDALAARALPAPVPVKPGTNSDANTAADSGCKPAKNSDPEGIAYQDRVMLGEPSTDQTGPQQQ